MAAGITVILSNTITVLWLKEIFLKNNLLNNITLKQAESQESAKNFEPNNSVLQLGLPVKIFLIIKILRVHILEKSYSYNVLLSLACLVLSLDNMWFFVFHPPDKSTVISNLQ